MHIILKFLKDRAVKYGSLFIVVLLVLITGAYLMGEWKVYQDAKKTQEEQWASLVQETNDPTIRRIISQRDEDVRINELEQLVRDQRNEVDRLENNVRRWHFPWQASRNHLRAGQAKLNMYEATLERAIAIRDGGGPRSRFFVFIEQAWAKVPLALTVVGFAVFTPMLIKVVFYYVLAPICQRRPAFQIVPSNLKNSNYDHVPSAVSLAIEVEPTEEILLQTEFLQSSSRKSKKRTIWFLNKSIPFSSLLSGMFMLTRIRPHDDKSTQVTVSSTRNGLAEVALIELPEGASIILKPRSLVGVVKQQNENVMITRHWRLNYLHAWLTMQLRFLAFHGPCKLIVGGERGIKIESPNELTSRMINQNATLGFSCELNYSCTRCETFWSYFWGRDTLFNDHFDGDTGFFVYEQTPTGGKGGPSKGKLEGFFEGFLKIFGL